MAKYFLKYIQFGIVFTMFFSVAANASIIPLQFDGQTSITVNDVNSSGQVVGQTTLADGRTVGYVTNPSGAGILQLIDSGIARDPLGGTFNLPNIVTSNLTAINDAGTVVGSLSDRDIGRGAFLSLPNETIRNVILVPGGAISAIDVDNSNVALVRRFGQISEVNLGVNDILHDYTLENVIEFGTLGSGRGLTSVNAINDAGLGAGASRNSESRDIAFIADSNTGAIQGLGTLGGRDSTALDINNLGQIVGISDDIFGNERAFIADLETGMRDLGSFELNVSRAFGLNDSGQVVGDSLVFTPTFAAENRAFIYLDDEFQNLCAVLDCLSSGWDYLTSARGITNNGYIIGYGSYLGNESAFLAQLNPSPIPLPAAAWLFGSALLGFLGFSRRKNPK